MCCLLVARVLFALCCLLHVVCRLLFAVCCLCVLLFAGVRCLLYVFLSSAVYVHISLCVGCDCSVLLLVSCFLFVGCLMCFCMLIVSVRVFVMCCSVVVVRCLLFIVACCLVCVGSCLLFLVCLSLFVVRRLLFVVCC